MKYIQEFRNSELVNNLREKISEITTQPWSIMEICGGQTHSIMKYNIELTTFSNFNSAASCSVLFSLVI